MSEVLGNCSFLEAKDPEGAVWDAVIIRAGLSKNGTYYPDAVLREAAPLFEGARVFAKADAEHLRGEGKDPNKIVGWFSRVRFVEGISADAGHIAGQFNFAAGARTLRETIVDAWKRGKRDLVGFSIDAVGRAVRAVREGAKQIATAITSVLSVDLIVDAAAGGTLVRLVEAASVTDDLMGGRASDIQLEDGSRKARDMLGAFFDPQHKDHARCRSFRECYVEITGDKRVTGRLDQCDRVRLTESLGTSSWPNVLSASLRRQMVKEYQRESPRSVWHKVASIAKNVNDFRTQERVRWGGYGNLPIVAQGTAYAALTSPADEKVTYALSKRGGTEDLTLEMIKNDDVSAIRLIPKRLAEAAERTVSDFVLDFLRTNPLIYDGVALFHASHGNLGNAALSAVSLNAARTAMRRQTELGSGKPLRLELRTLLVPLDLEETAYNLFRRGTNNDKTFVQNLNLDIAPVVDWSDTSDWCVSAAPEDCPTIEIAFLGGAEDPDLFVQDPPTVGSLFANDKVTMKIRHIYGGAVVDFRGLFKAVV